MLREKTAETVGRRPEPAVLLLRDLHLAAAENSLYWEMLAQAAQAAQASKDRRLLALTADCHPQILRQMRWANTLIVLGRAGLHPGEIAMDDPDPLEWRGGGPMCGPRDDRPSA